MERSAIYILPIFSAVYGQKSKYWYLLKADIVLDKKCFGPNIVRSIVWPLQGRKGRIMLLCLHIGL